MRYNFNKVINRIGTHCTQWDYTEDRFGQKNILPFSISDMDFKSPPEILLSIKKRINHGIFGYTRWNHNDFKYSVINWYKTRFTTDIEENWIVYSPTVIYTISKLIEILTNKNDNIVVNIPGYDAFFKLINANKRSVLKNKLILSNSTYTIDFEDLEDKLSDPLTKVFLLCSPHNPTGRVWTREELIKIIDLCKKYNVYIISDEIHMDIVYKPNTHIPIIKIQGVLDKIFICSSTGKTFNTAGLHSSYVLIPNAKIRDKFLTILKERDGLSPASIMGITALTSAYNECSDWADELVEYLHSNMVLVQDYICENIPFIKFTIPQSTYLAWIDVSTLKCSCNELQQVLVDYAKVGIMPGKTYECMDGKFLRMNIGCPKTKVSEGLQRLKKAIDYINNNYK